MDNVSAQELDKFSHLANDWWDPNGPCRPLHAINPARLQFISDRCDLNSTQVLDIGCGGGILTEALARRGALVTGIDANVDLIEVARSHALDHKLNIHYESTLAENFATDHSKQFDVITCMELLEHVPDPNSLIQACAALLKPGGHCFFSTLNRTLKAYCLAIVGAEIVLKLLPRHTHEYEKFIRPSELKTALEQAGLKLQDLSGLYYNPILKQTRLTQDVSVNYLAHAR